MRLFPACFWPAISGAYTRANSRPTPASNDAPGGTDTTFSQLISEIESGVVPIMDGDQFEGVITDRDPVCGVIGESRDTESRVNKVMTTTVAACPERNG